MAAFFFLEVDYLFIQNTTGWEVGGEGGEEVRSKIDCTRIGHFYKYSGGGGGRFDPKSIAQELAIFTNIPRFAHLLYAF